MVEGAGAVPNPGSILARLEGCLCVTVHIRAGRNYRCLPGVYLYDTERCPIHRAHLWPASAAADLTRLNAELDARDVEAFDAAVAHGKTKLDLTRLNAKVEELERERLKLRTALIGTGRNLGAFLANEVSSDFLTLLPEEARLLKARLARAVEVKALEWTKLSTGWIAHTSFHAYEVVATDHGFMATYANRDFAWGEEETMKVAAQADFEQRIRSALVLSEQENPHG